jgi:hypothetical protein
MERVELINFIKFKHEIKPYTLIPVDIKIVISRRVVFTNLVLHKYSIF